MKSFKQFINENEITNLFRDWESYNKELDKEIKKIKKIKPKISNYYKKGKKDFVRFKGKSREWFEAFVKKELKPKYKDKFNNMNYKYDNIIKLDDALKMEGLEGEKRTYKDTGLQSGMMFGNFTLAEWYYFLKDIADNGLKTPVHIFIDKSGKKTISEGNHRLQALKILGYTKVAVTYGHE